MSDEPAKTDSKVSHAVEETKSVNRATTEPSSEHGATEPSAERTAKTASRVSHGDETTTGAGHHAVEADAEISAERAAKKSSAELTGSETRPKHAGRKPSADGSGSKMGATRARKKLSAGSAASEMRDKRAGGKPSAERPGTEPSAERAATETTARPAAEEPKAETAAPRRESKAGESPNVGAGAAPQLPASSDGDVPGRRGKFIEVAAFATVVAIVIMIGIAMFNSAHGRVLKGARQRADDDPLQTAIYRRGRSWHGYGPQLLVCTLGERRRLGSPESLPPDGLCDLVLYAHVRSLGADFDDGASANLRALWTRASTAVKTRTAWRQSTRRCTSGSTISPPTSASRSRSAATGSQ
ncbi:transcriptional regulatory protein AlgP-like [Dermacentor silvarum]|uniref:transcriptional regulatory protein AlgP-like n=1 Tax=Dermacentor silvarum TaxID=543639 RepID=UPI00210076E3|nr:transcriptional regulatory protein AlgP-like [Dermacentor silvarum]